MIIFMVNVIYIYNAQQYHTAATVVFHIMPYVIFIQVLKCISYICLTFLHYIGAVN